MDYKSDDKNKFFELERKQIVSVEDAVKFLQIVEMKLPQVKKLLQQAGGLVYQLQGELGRKRSMLLGSEQLANNLPVGGVGVPTPASGSFEVTSGDVVAPMPKLDMPSSIDDEQEDDKQLMADRIEQMKNASIEEEAKKEEVEEPNVPNVPKVPEAPKVQKKKVKIAKSL